LALDSVHPTLVPLQNALTGITDITLTSARRMATMVLIGSPMDSLSERAPGTVDTVDTMDAGSDEISMTAGMATLGVANSATALDVEVMEERVFAANAASGAVNLTVAVSAAANLMAAASEAAKLTVEAVSAAEAVHEVEVSVEAALEAVAALEVEASAAVAPVAEAVHMVEDTGRLCAN
jgi:hypothetical protein